MLTVSQGWQLTINNILLFIDLNTNDIFLGPQIKIWKCTDKNDLHED